MNRGVTSFLRAGLLPALLAAGALLVPLLASAAPADAASSYGELLRFGGKGTNRTGAEFQFAGEETHAFAVDPASGSVYVGDETAEGSEKLRVQSYSASGAFEGEATIKPPNLPKGIASFEGYEGFAVTHEENRIYVLATFKRFAEDAFDGNIVVAGALYALKSTPTDGKLEPAEGTGKEGLLGSAETLDANSETQGKALLEPSGIAVDPLTGEVLILGIDDEGAGALHTAVEHVSSKGAVLFTWIDPATVSEETEPDSPVVSARGKLFFESGDELLALPASATSGAPEAVFSFAEPETLETGPFVGELASFGEGETSFGGGLSIISEGAASEGRLVAFAEIHAMTEAGGLGEDRNGALNFNYVEEGEHVRVSEAGWTGGVPGEGAGEKVKPCEIGFANANPSAAATGDDGVDFLSPAWSEVIELGPGGSGCPPAEEAPSGLEVTLDGKRVASPEISDTVTLLARIVQANVLSVTWVFGDGQETVVATASGEQTQTAEIAHKFVKTGDLTVEAIIHTDNLATPELRLKSSVDVIETRQGSPKVKQQPVPTTVLEGETAKLEASASGEPQPTTQWEVSTDKGEKWTSLTGQTRDTLELADVATTQNGYQYRATFDNGVGTPVSSAAATLTVETEQEREAKILKQQQEEEPPVHQQESRTPPPTSEPESPKPAQQVDGLKEASPRATLASTSLSVSAAGAVVVKVSCPTGVSECTGTVTLRTLSALAAARGTPATKKSILTLAQGSFSVPGGQSRALTLHLSSEGRRLLGRSHSLHVRATVASRDPAGASQTVLGTVTLRLTKPR
jgi:Immunoglobulin I-set domain